jgi:hypothetical protein
MNDAWFRDPDAELRKRTEKTSQEMDQIHTYLDDVRSIPSF